MTEPEVDAPRIVWAVTSGEYSDYRVRALFEREADAIAAKGKGLGDDVGEFSYFPAGRAPTKIGYWRASRGVTTNGSLRTPSPRETYPPEGRAMEAWTIDGFVPPVRPRVTVRKFTHSDLSWHVEVEAMTQEATVKALSDAVAKLRSEIFEAEQAKPKPGQKPDRGRS